MWINEREIEPVYLIYTSVKNERNNGFNISLF